jgi:hypothetical protein
MGNALQLGEEPSGRSGLYQGTSLLVPQEAQKQRRALQAAEKVPLKTLFVHRVVV